MPLARKFSSVFKKKPEPVAGPPKVTNTPTVPEEDDYELRLAIQASLKQDTSTLSKQNEQLKAELRFEQQQRVNQTRKLAQENVELRTIITSLQTQGQSAANGVSQKVVDLEQQLGANRRSINDQSPI
jgi:hypothetical protein